MPIITFADGVQLDTDTGQVVGQAEPQRLAPGEAQRPTVDIPPESAGRGAVDALKQLSVGFNAALFALPDATIKAVGQALNVREDQIPTFAAYFNRGAAAPKNAVERFSNAIGQGVGGTMPFTGLLGAVARTRALTGPISPGAPVVKQVAKDMLDFIRQNPKAAILADLGFGGVYGAAEQSVEEFVQPGEEQQLLKATVPFAATVAIPAAGAKFLSLASRLADISPTVKAARAVPEMFGAQTAEGYAADVARESMPRVPVIGGPLQWLGTKYAASAERKITDVLAPLFSEPGKAPPGVAEALAVTRRIETDPELRDLFLFTAGEQSLYAPLIAAQNSTVKNLSGQLLTDEQARVAQNVANLGRAFDLYAPRAALPLDDALRATYAQSVDTITKAAQRVSRTTEDEALRIADTFVMQNLDELGDNLRRGIFGQMNAQFNRMRKMQEEAMGGLPGVGPEGVRTPVRAMGEPLPAYLPTTAAFKGFAERFIQKFKLTPDERMFPEGAPEPVRFVQREMQRYNDRLQKRIEEVLPQIINREMNKDPFFSKVSAESRDQAAQAYASAILSGRDISKTLPTGVQGPSPETVKRVMKEATDQASKDVEFSITMPEAMDLLGSAMNFRNMSILRANKEMDLGNPRNMATGIVNRGDAVLRDVEDFIFSAFKNSPQMKEFQGEYKDTFSKGYEKLFPLLITKRSPIGDFYVSNERVVNEALKNAENIRNMNAIFGTDPEYISTMNKVMLDRAARSKVLAKDGTLDTARYERWLGGNKNLIDALPDPVQRNLREELRFADDYAARFKELKDREDLVKDEELMTLLKKSVRPDADPAQLVKQAVNDPAVMRKLVSTVGKDEDRLNSLRRQVWTNVRENIFDPANPTYLQDFLQRNGKSLSILYSPQQRQDLELLAEIQRRVFVANRPQGTLSAFRSLDEQLREKIGAGIGTIESTARAATIRQISPIHAGVTLMTRFLGRQQTSIYEAIMYKALTDPVYARQLASANGPLNSKENMAKMSEVTLQAGGFLPNLLRGMPRVALIEASQAAMTEEQRPIATPEFTRGMAPAPRPPVPRMPAPPAPARTLTQSPAASTAAPQQAPAGRPVPGFGEQYQALFPNDPMANLIQQRRQ
jgi:antitoxin component HigA of HigAB toxin-antitoxin module